jgi:hypothetical protein
MSSLRTSAPDEDIAVAAPPPRRSRLAVWWPLLVSLAVALLVSVHYVRRTYVDVVMLDGFAHVPFVDQVLDGNATLSSVTAEPYFGEHLYLGYRAIMIANGALFGLDMRLDPVLFVLAFAGVAVLYHLEVARVVSQERRWPLWLLTVPLVFLSFSLVAPPLMLMTTQFVWACTVAVGIAVLAQRGIYGERRRLPFLGALGLLPVYYFLSGAYFPGLIAGLVGVHLARALLERRGLFDRRSLLLVGSAVGGALAYTALLVSTQEGEGDSVSGGLTLLVTDAGRSVLTYFAGLSAAVLDTHTLERSSDTTVTVLGGLVALTTVTACWLFWRTKMYERTYLPIFSIFYSLGIMTAVRAGRGSRTGWRGITAEWYAYHLRFLVIGVVWILLHALVLAYAARRSEKPTGQPVRRTLQVLAAVSGLTLITASQAYGNQAQWERAPHVKAYYAEKQRALLYPELYPDDSAVLLWPAPALDRARAALREHRLSGFSEVHLDTLDQDAAPITGGEWYPDGWIGRAGQAVVRVSAPRTLTLKLDAAPFLPTNKITVRLGSRVLIAEQLRGGTSRQVAVPLTVGVNVLSIDAATAVSPQSLGTSPDERPLSVHATLS